MYELIRPDSKIDFVGKRKMWLGISIVCILVTIVLFFTKGLNYGIDFTGGAEVQLKVPQAWDTGKVRNSLGEGGLSNFKVQQIGQPAEHTFIVKAAGDAAHLNEVSGRIEGILGKSLQKGEYELQRIDVVGPAAGSSLRMSGLLSMIYALACILIYVTIRFDGRYSPGAVLALFHDTVITIGVFIITQKQFDLQILAAILALVGYSNNDTIIVYDRVRETLYQYPKLSISEAVNKAINETLGRTILTSLCTFLTVFSLWVFGGKVIEDFAFTLMIGIVVGTYSSIFIASSLVIYFTERQDARSVAEKSGGAKKKRQYTVRAEPKLQ